MNTRVDAERQGQPVGLRRPQVQLTLMCVADALESVVDDLANGETVRGTDGAREILDHVLSEAKTEAAAIESLARYRPLFEIDSKLHEMRREVLSKRAARLGWPISWGDDGSASLDMGWGSIAIDRRDNWSMPSGTVYGDYCGAGLTSLIATLDGEHTAITTAKVSRWLDKRENVE